MTQRSKKKNKQKKYPLLLIAFIAALSLLVLFVIGSFIYNKYQDNKRTHQLRETDKDIQKFGNVLEQSFPGQVHREKYCRHDGVKFGKGALRCISQIEIRTKYLSEETLSANIHNVNQIFTLLHSFTKKGELPSASTPDSAATHGLIPLVNRNTSMSCSVDYAFVHFDSVAVDRRGEFSFSAHCTAGPLQRPIYELKD